MSYAKISGNAGLMLGIIILAVLAYYFSKAQLLPIPLKQGVFRFMVAQETNLRTGNWEEVNTSHFKIKYLPQDQYSIQLVSDAAEDAYIKVTNLMGQQPRKRTTIVIYPDNASLAASFGWDKNEKAVGVYWGGTIRILSPEAWLANIGQRDRFIKDGPMVHEFTHLMVDELTRGNYNRWWTEGVAQYAERDITGFKFASPFKEKSDLYYYQLDNLEKNYDRLDQSVAYWESLQAVDFIASRYGQDRILGIIDNLSNGDTIAKAVEDGLGVEYATFSREFYQYLENQ